jgi:hypothetical protein
MRGWPGLAREQRWGGGAGAQSGKAGGGGRDGRVVENF